MKVKIKLSKKHPNNAMNYYRYVITTQEQVVELNDEEIKHLDDVGPKHWFMVEEIRSEEVKSSSLEDLSNQELKELCLEKGIEVKSRETKAELIKKLSEL